jgi:hypothetical protein
MFLTCLAPQLAPTIFVFFGVEQVNTSLLTLPLELPSPFLPLHRYLHFWPNLMGDKIKRRKAGDAVCIGDSRNASRSSA